MKEFRLSCPPGLPAVERVTMAHGGGGRMTQRLVQEVFQAAFQDPALAEAHDGAILPFASGGALAFTTDSFVVKPLFFPGGDIGSLAVYGSVNDLAMCAAEPLYLSCGFILEEGLPLETLSKVAASMARAARAAGTRVVTGDTKVVEAGKGDGIYVTTSAVGRCAPGAPVGPARIRPGDAVILSGDVGAHGAAILSVREDLGFETGLQSDCAPLWPQVRALLEAGIELHCLRDLTRGGLATAVNELAQASGTGFELDEPGILVRPEVEGVCEVLGLDPHYMACEGRFVALVSEARAPETLETLRRAGAAPSRIGTVVDRHPREARLKTRTGVTRVLDMLSGEQLPRIC